MNLPNARRKPFPVADRMRDGTPVESQHPKLRAIRYLREKIYDRQAGLDPYDRGVFVLIAHENELVWANRAIDLCGWVLPTSTDTIDGGKRFRCALYDDVLADLGLTGAFPAVIEDEPLASRAVRDTDPDAVLRVLHPLQPRLDLVPDLGDESEAMAALKQARHTAALRVDCGCGAPAKQECGCDDVDRMTSALAQQNLVDDERQVH